MTSTTNYKDRLAHSECNQIIGKPHTKKEPHKVTVITTSNAVINHHNTTIKQVYDYTKSISPTNKATKESFGNITLKKNESIFC